jgi:hypothetical protein
MQTMEIYNIQAIFVIVVREALVARDIEMAIRDWRPDARVVVAFDLPDAAAAVPMGRIDTLFVQVDASTVVASDLGQRVALDGGTTVLVGPDADDVVPEGWSALPFPFNNDHLTSVLTRVAAMKEKPRAVTPMTKKDTAERAGHLSRSTMPRAKLASIAAQ